VKLEKKYSLRDGLEKLAYGEKEHRGLAGVTSRNVGARKGDARNLIVSGSLKADRGIRHPWLPHTDRIHAFAGSQHKADIGRSVAQKQRSAVGDIASSIAGGKGRQGLRGYLKSGVRGARGLQNLGEAQHTVMDIGSHYEKPLAEGGATRLRKVVPRTGYGGGIVGGKEHVNVEKLVRGRGRLQGIADIDKLSPATSRIDASSVRRAGGFGRAARRHVEAALVSHHGMSADEAAKAATHFFEKSKFSPASRRIGSLSRDSRFVRGEISRAGQTLKRVGRGVGRRLLLRR